MSKCRVCPHTRSWPRGKSIKEKEKSIERFQKSIEKSIKAIIGHLNMDCGLDNSITPMLNFLILIFVCIACIAGGFLYYWATSTVQLWGQAQWQILNVHPHLLLPSPSLICVCVQMYVHTHSHTLFHEPFDSKLQTLYPFISKYVSMYFL